MSEVDVTSAGQRLLRQHTVAQWAILCVNLLVVIGCIAGAVGLLYGKRQLDGTLAGQALSVSTTVYRPVSTDSVLGGSSTVPVTFPEADPNAVNFLITGSDANACVDPDSPWAGAADPSRDAIGSRSDTIMVMRVDPTTSQAAVLSFPRDLWVDIPGRAKNRINTAAVPGDSTVLAQTIYDNFGITIDHYLQVDFCAFKLIVDAVGGVTVPFQFRIVDRNVGLDVKPGCHTFSGDEALAYARSRHLKWIDENGESHEDRGADLARISRQQDFLRRTLMAALEKGVFDPAVARALIESLQKYIVRDGNLLSIDSVLAFAGVLKNINPSGINTYQVDAANTVVSGQAVLDPITTSDNMKAILAIFRGEAPLAGGVSGGSSTTVADTGTTAPVEASGTTVVAPEENVKGDIVPNEDIVC
ncbi:MAG: LCP family protein [Ilumatobacteraceae bacterium]